MSTSKKAWASFNKQETMHQLEAYLTGREYGHGEYCHYTKLSVVNAILENKEFWIGAFNKFNDTIDGTQFVTEDRLHYGLCFSTGINENISLWYLYAGTNGQGARIKFSNAGVRHLVEEGTYTLYQLKEDGISKGPKIMDLELGKTMNRTFRDMIYYKEHIGEDKCDLKYNTMTNYHFPQDEFHKYKKKYCGFCKQIGWYYEKETRLLVELIGKSAEYVRSNRDAEYIVTLNFSNISTRYLKLKLTFAPEVDDILAVINNDRYSAIKRYIIESSCASDSEYHKQIKMGLCEKCDKCKTCNKISATNGGI